MPNLSILIPARNEEFLTRTVTGILANIRGDTEVIVVCDGNWPCEPIEDDERVQLIHHSQSIGQRAATNEAARISRAKYIMKVDAHCMFAEGFDEILTAECDYDWTIIPRMYNLHAFDWECLACHGRIYQGPYPQKCEKCGENQGFERVMVWQPRWSRKSDFMRFDQNLHFQYWGSLEKRPESQPEIAETMSLLGACWMLRRERYWELGGMDEKHGSWGQMGTEIACKSFLSGGRLLVNKKTWFSHLFRTRPGFSWPYSMSSLQQAQAKEYSRWLWRGNNWEKAIYPLSWLIKRFSPVPDWDDESIRRLEEEENAR